MTDALKGKWALILGASSGFGGAAARELSKHGVNIIGVHLDRKGTLPQVEALVAEVKKNNVEVQFFNVNAADDDKRREVLDAVQGKIGKETILCLFHSLAFGALRSFVHEDDKERITRQQMDMTLDVMANSLVYWTQDLHSRKLLTRGSRIFSMTSSGSDKVWAKYGAVSAAKAALEAHTRQLGFELQPEGIAVNALRAGVTDTPSLRKIPGHEDMIRVAKERIHSSELTTPEHVARTLVALCLPGIEWMTANVINVDGGEYIG